MHSDSHPADSPYLVHSVPPTRPFVWLGKAWEDLRSHPLPSLAYGFLVSFLGFMILLMNNHPYIVAGSLTLFLLVGPILTTGLCELSRRRDSGEIIDFEKSLHALHHNRRGLYGFAKSLLLIGVVWMLLSTCGVISFWCERT